MLIPVVGYLLVSISRYGKIIATFEQKLLLMQEKVYKHALITKSTGSWYQVKTEDGLLINCRIRGKFRIKGLSATNPLAVGDWVDIKIENNQETGLISHIYDRKNYIVRKSIKLSKQVQIIASNIDQAFLLITLASPPTSLGFIDRFLVTAEAHQVPPILVFNKLDLFSEIRLDVLEECMDIYEGLGYSCLKISAKEGTNLDAIRILLQDKTSLMIGHSGAGKSTLINQLIGGLDLRTGSISSFSDKGKHTTTFAEMFPLPTGGYVIDTPGIQEMGIVDIQAEELGHFFPEFRERLQNCRFYNCKHINEPGCAVIQSIDDGSIAESRYQSYLSMYQGNETRA